MIRIVVDSVDEETIVRRVLKTEACSHCICPKDTNANCDKCVKDYYKDDLVKLYKRETVEIPRSIVL